MRRSASPAASKPTPMATARVRSRPVRGSADDDGSAWLDEDVLVLETLDDVVLLELTADVELLVEGLVEGAVDELEDVLGAVLGAVGWVLVEPEWPPDELEWWPEPDDPEPPSGSVYC